MGEGKGGFGHDEVGDGSRVQADFLDAAAELAGGASAPREELEGRGIVLVGWVCVGVVVAEGVEKGNFSGN